MFRRKGVVERTKIALLQSKRLYPVESEAPAEDQAVDYEVGFGRLLESEQEFRSAIKQRKFTFAKESRYRALEYQGKQYQAILKYIQDEGVPVHYLFHNPLTLPSAAILPVEADKVKTKATSCDVGCRVVGAVTLDLRLQAAKLKHLENPSFAQSGGASERLDSSCWRLEHFVADLVLGCKEGYLGGTNPMEDSKLFRVFSRRSGPISAAISVTIDAPTE
jgi:hypothetical protein